jgi:hypothetical protein
MPFGDIFRKAKVGKNEGFFIGLLFIVHGETTKNFY